MKKIVFIVGLFYSVLAMAEGQVDCVSSRDEMSGQVTSKCTVKDAANDIFGTGVAPIDYNKMVQVKPVEDPYKVASDIVNQNNKEIANLAKMQADLEERKQAAIDAQNKKLQEAQLISDFNNYKDGLSKVITSLETQAGRQLNDEERLRVYTTYQKQLTDGLTAVGRNDLAEQAKVIYDPKLLFSLDRGSQAVPQQVNDVGVSSNNEGWTAYVILVSIIIGVIGFTFFARNR
ncbi:MAG: hypothetical protein LWW74_04545, partial [Burkholderiales bacterium]|nr:hypothetical protein [Burkholderiales bacterium]